MAAQELEAAKADAQLKKKSRPNNVEAAEEFVTEVNTAVNKFTLVFHSYKPYKIKKRLTPTLSPGIMIS